MKRWRAIGLAGTLLALLALLVAGWLWGSRLLAARRVRASADELRSAICRRVGLPFDPAVQFVALPSVLPHHSGRARLGEQLVADRRLACSRWRTCCACHSPDLGWTDSKMHGGVVTPSICNAAISLVYLHDGRMTNLVDVVRLMIEDSRYGGAGPLSNVVSRLAADRQILESFRRNYDQDLNVTNLLDSIDQFARTQLISNRAFDAWCDGRDDALDATQKKGAEIFQMRGCLTCHDGPALGALRKSNGKKVPSLRGLARRRVFLADGSCTDVGTVFARMPGGDMESEARVAMVAFLKTL